MKSSVFPVLAVVLLTGCKSSKPCVSEQETAEQKLASYYASPSNQVVIVHPPSDGSPNAEAPPSMIYVGGEFKFPNRYAWTNGMTLKDGVSAAGGLTEFANHKIWITHWDGSREVYRWHGDIMFYNPLLRPGDKLTIYREW